LIFNVTHAEQNKNDTGDFLKSCTGTIEVKFIDEIHNKYKQLENETEKNNSFAFAGGKQILKDVIKADYKIKKKDSGDGFFISGKYTSKNNWKLMPVVLDRVNNIQEIILISKQIETLGNINSSLTDNEKDGTEIQKIISDKNLNLEYCDQSLDNNSAQTICRISNDSGFIDIIYKRQFSFFESEMLKMVGSTGKSRITDPIKLKEVLNDKKLFTSAGEVRSEKSCKITPSICREN
jgi:hypothetical protein